MRLLRAIALVTLAALLALGGAGVAEGKQSVRCRAGQVRIKSGKKTRCRPISAVLPKPQKIDPRVVFIKTALDQSVPKGRRHAHGKRRSKPLRTGFGRAGRKAYKKILKALPKALAKVDAKAPGRAPAGLARAAQAADPCGSGGEPFKSDTTSDNGVIMTSTLTTAGMGMTAVVSAGGYSVVIEYFSSQGCGDLEVPDCPTASGAADAAGGSFDRVRIDVRKDGHLLSSRKSSLRSKMKTHGQTAADAKLDFVDVDTSAVMTTSADGVALKGTLTRHVHINMRTEQYDPELSTASFEGAQALQKTNNRSFAALANNIMSIYRSAESAPGRLGLRIGWSVFDRVGNSGDYCIHMEYSPPSLTMKLKKGATGTFTGRAIARNGGGPAADGRWEQTEAFHGTFSPSPASGGSPTFNYRVTDTTPGELAGVDFKITSTAGVNTSSWAQETEEFITIDHVKGNISGSETQATSAGAPSMLSFTGSVAYDRVFGTPPFGGAEGTFSLVQGDYTLVASGTDGSGVTGCHQTGSKHFTISSGRGSMDIKGTPPSHLGPYAYKFEAVPPFATMTVTRTACPAGAEEWNGTTFQTGLHSPLKTQRNHGSDGKTYTDSEDQTSGGSGLQLKWAFQGTQ
jgi:hypothetical protein